MPPLLRQMRRRHWHRRFEKHQARALPVV